MPKRSLGKIVGKWDSRIGKAGQVVRNVFTECCLDARELFRFILLDDGKLGKPSLKPVIAFTAPVLFQVVIQERNSRVFFLASFPLDVWELAGARKVSKLDVGEMTVEKVGKALNSAKDRPWRNSALWNKGYSVQGVPLDEFLI